LEEVVRDTCMDLFINFFPSCFDVVFSKNKGMFQEQDLIGSVQPGTDDTIQILPVGQP
jgi:hypothetical protein